MKKYFALFLILVIAAAFAACGDDPAPNSNTANNNLATVNAGSVGPESTAPDRADDTPTEAYKRLFAAVKSKNPDAIKAEFSRGSIGTALAQAKQARVPVEEVYKNGFTATTFADTLPEIRDERVNGTMGAVEVWNTRDKKWEDLPFIRETSGWKLAVGEAFDGRWIRPGLGRAMRDQQAANSASGTNRMIKATNVNLNQLGNAKIISNSNR